MINLLVELRSCYGSIEPVASPFLWGPMEHIQRNRLLSYSEIETMGSLWGFAVKPFAVPIFHLGSPRKTDPTKYQISFGKLRKKLFFGGLGGVRFIHFEGAKQSGKLPSSMLLLFLKYG
jgi:hypothetical protein